MARNKSVIFLLMFSIITYVNGRIIGQENKLLSDMNSNDLNVPDGDFKMARHRIDRENTPYFRLKSMKMFADHDIHSTHKMTSLNHFGRHDLCTKDKTRFYTALQNNLCYTNSKFISQLMEQICNSKGKQLDMWVAELFDLTGDGFVNHFERSIYDL